MDVDGNIYFLDSNTVRKVSGGVITTIAGDGTDGYTGDNGPAVNAKLNYPYGIAVDSNGNVFLADT